MCDSCCAYDAVRRHSAQDDNSQERMTHAELCGAISVQQQYLLRRPAKLFAAQQLNQLRHCVLQKVNVQNFFAAAPSVPAEAWRAHV